MRLFTAQFTDSYFPVTDGVANVTHNYALWLNRSLGPCTVVAPWFPRSRNGQDGVRVLSYPSLALAGNRPYRFGLPVAPAFFRHLAALPLDLVHVQSPLMSVFPARWAAWRRRIPLVASFHTKYRDDFSRFWGLKPVADQFIRWMVQFYESVDSVWVPSRSTADTLREYGYGGETVVLANGTDLVAPEDTGQLRQAACRDLGIPEDRFVLLFIGQHTWEKNHALLLEALARVRARRHEFLMVFAGTGYAADALRQKATALGLEASVRFLGPVVDRDRIRRLYARADLFLFPSLYDTSPLTIREAAAFRVPTVFVRGATATEGIVHDDNGFLAPNTAEGYAAIMADLMARPHRIAAAGERAQRTLYRSWEQVAREVADHYQRIVRERWRYGARQEDEEGMGA